MNFIKTIIDDLSQKELIRNNSDSTLIHYLGLVHRLKYLCEQLSIKMNDLYPFTPAWSQRYHWFSSEMTREERTQKLHTDCVSLTTFG